MNKNITPLKIVYIEASSFIEQENGFTTFQLDNVCAITEQNNHIHLHPNDPDKFSVTSDDLATARSEFWQRFKLYIQRRFNRSFIPVHIINK